jgi:hypothetical protein
MRSIVLTFLISATIWLLCVAACVWLGNAIWNAGGDTAQLLAKLFTATLVTGCVAFIVVVIFTGALLGEALARLFGSKVR